MAIFQRFPYTDFHRLNADWILEKIKEMLGLTRQAAEDAAEAAETVETYGDRLTTVEAKADGAVRFDVEQQLSGTQQTRARANISAAPAIGVVMYNTSQALDNTYKAQARSNIGAASSAAEAQAAGAVRFDTDQSLTNTQKAQARENIGAADSTSVPTDAVRYNAAQSLSGNQQARARTNIGAASDSDLHSVASDLDALELAAVRSDITQSLSSAQQQQARQNIGAASVDSVLTGAVLYSSAQVLNTTEKAQARTNIGAPSSSDVLPFTDPSAYASLGIQDDSVGGGQGDEVTASLLSTEHQSIVILVGDCSTNVRLRGVAAPDQDSDAVPKGYADDHYDPLWHEETVTGSTPAIALGSYDNRPILNCGECSSITITGSLPEWILKFDSGSTPTVLMLPGTINMPASFQVNANCHYEINVNNLYGLASEWELEVTP